MRQGVKPPTLIAAETAKTRALHSDGPGPHLDDVEARARSGARARVRRKVSVVLAEGVHHLEDDVVADMPLSYVLPGDVCLK